MEEVTMENQMDKSKTRIVIPSQAEESARSFPFGSIKTCHFEFFVRLTENCEQIPGPGWE
jgi:hypothetical protein